MEGVVDIEDTIPDNSPGKQNEEDEKDKKTSFSKEEFVPSEVQLNIANSNFDDGNSGKKSKYSCVQCPFTSFYPGNLRVHMRRHTGNEPFFFNLIQLRISPMDAFTFSVSSKINLVVIFNLQFLKTELIMTHV